MKQIDKEYLDKHIKPIDRNAEHYIKVGLDTGGIAAGADEVYDALLNEKERSGSLAPVCRTGSLGMSYLDPLVEVNVEGMPSLIYGNVDVETARKIVKNHVMGKELVDGYAVASKNRATELGDEATRFILVKDTSAEGGDKTNFFKISLMEELKRNKLDKKVQVVEALDMNLYDKGVCVQLLPSGVTYSNVLAQDVSRIIKDTMVGGTILDDLLFKATDKQERIVLRNCGIVDPESIDDYINSEGYQALKKVLDGTPDDVIETLKASGLRGRGGAGFPVFLKWHLTRQSQSDQKYVICNADEGDPGAFMDRSILEGDPHAVLEGLMIAAYVIGASKGYFYIRAEYPLAIKRVQMAIDQAKERGLLGKDILGTGFDFEAKVRLGAGAFVCGEETALIASIEGKRGSPIPRPPFPGQKGLWEKPTSINNVETLANIGAIINRGGDWYAQFGTDKSKGTKVFAVTGKVKNAQLVEVPLGITLRDIIYEICGGIMDDTPIKAVQTGGPSGGVIPEQLLDTEISYENLSDLGSIMGSGGMLAMDQNDCMVDVAKFYLKFCVDESCGKCAPCRIGGYQLLQLLDRISRGRGKEEDLEQLKRISLSMQKASLCGLGQTAPNPVLSTLRYFLNEYTAYIEGGASYARKMKKKLSGESDQKAG